MRKSALPSLNHIAFEMTDVDAVMRGIARLREAGYEAVWGPGRHGPGNNVFGYFIAPYGGVIEYTAEVSEVGDDYRVGTPEDWKWPPGRIDHWGISKKDTAKTGPAEQVLRFKGLKHVVPAKAGTQFSEKEDWAPAFAGATGAAKAAS